MLLLLLDWLREIFHLKIPAAFTYFSTRMILASVTSLLMTIFWGPAFIKKLYEWKIGQPIRSVEEVPLLAELHGKKKDTPTMGGVLILSSMLASLLLWMDWGNIFTWIFFLTTLVLGYLGAMDDYFKLRFKNSKGISSRRKMGVQLLFSSLIALYLLVPSLNQWIGETTTLTPPVAKEQILQK